MTNNLIKNTNGQVSFTSFMRREDIQKMIGDVLTPAQKTRFAASLISAVTANEALKKCEYQTILSAALIGEGLNLSPSQQLGHYYLVPYKDSKANRQVAQFQLGYKGMIQLASRSGNYKHINVLEIKEGELVNWNALTEEIEVNLIEDEDERENVPTIGYYASFEYLNGFKKSMYWSTSKMKSHAKKYSNSCKNGFGNWKEDFDGMAKKTMLRQLISKWGIMSIEMQQGYQADQAIIKEDGGFAYIDNPAAIETEAEEVKEVEEDKKTEAVNFWEANK